jgi:hypothetical protein
MRRFVVHIAALALTHLLLGPLAAGQVAATASAPETFNGSAEVKTEAASATANFEVHINRYTPDFDRTAVETGLKQGGYRGFLAALRRAPVVGHVVLGRGDKVPIRWARQQTGPKGRSIVVITDKPVFYLGAGRAEPVPRENFQVALIEIQIDDKGTGEGTMAAAARVKLGEEAGSIVIDDYAEAPIKLTSIKRKV